MKPKKQTTAATKTKTIAKTNFVKGYKVFNPDFSCRGFQFKENTEYTHKGEIRICNSGFHFCVKAAHCFEYYSFDPVNIVCEVEARGKVLTHEEDSKICTDILYIGRKLTWQEVLAVANDGANNTGRSNSGNSNSGNSNSGDSNSGYSNSGNWNSGNSNSGNWNSGNSNSGNWNSGNSNSGYSNSGNWNSGNRNSGDSNSGYRNSGAFCTDANPILYLFNKPTKMTVKEWESHAAVNLMYKIDPTIWIPENMMTEEEKKAHPKYETTEGYLKTISMQEAWANFWHNLEDRNKEIFTTLPNFDADIFEEITGIKTK